MLECRKNLKCGSEQHNQNKKVKFTVEKLTIKKQMNSKKKKKKTEQKKNFHDNKFNWNVEWQPQESYRESIAGIIKSVTVPVVE